MHNSDYWKNFFSDKIEHAFICGCGHSGTSLLLAILSHHSRIYGIPSETELLLSKNGYLLYKVSESYAIEHKKQFLLEKTPRHVRHLDTILNHIPKSYVIIMFRNPLDTIGSLKRRGYNFLAAAERYIFDNNAALQYKDHPKVLTVKYEDMIESPQNILQQICKFLNIAYEEQIFEYYKSPINYFGAHE
ncbi:sulfotransferase, partial [Desulfovibrio sp. OttesenSCG-928-I05]|nr:sulfotransferase [Desulfovibrio sp. OttesenSCG-928-I05]